jgi:hypothetical protein
MLLGSRHENDGNEQMLWKRRKKSSVLETLIAGAIEREQANSQEDEPAKSDAETRADLLRSDRAATAEAMRNSPVSASRIAEIDAGVSALGTTTENLVNDFIREMLGVVVSAAAGLPNAPTRRLAKAHIVIIDSDSPSASAEAFESSGLIRITDAMATMCSSIATSVHAAAADGPKGFPAATAALRWRIHQRRAFGEAGQILRTPSFADADEIGVTPLLFILAHELGHIALGHPSGVELSDTDVTMRHEYEHEADFYGYLVMCELLAGSPVAELQLAVGMGISAATIESDILFIRPPTTHPGVQERFGRLVKRLGQFGSDPRFAAFDQVLGHAASITRPLPEEWWDAVMKSRRWNTSVHEPHQYDLVRHLDRMLGADDATLTRVIDSVESTGELSQSVKRARTVGQMSDLCKRLEMRRTALALAGGSPVSIHSAVVEFIESPIALRIDEEFFRRVVGILIAQRAQAIVHEEEGLS